MEMNILTTLSTNLTPPPLKKIISFNKDFSFSILILNNQVNQSSDECVYFSVSQVS